MSESVSGELNIAVDGVRTSPNKSKAFVERSASLLSLVALLQDSETNPYAETFNLAWVVEFSLKGYLLNKNIPENRIKNSDNRHHLMNLYVLARESGLQIECVEWISILGDQHYKEGEGYPLRYSGEDGFIDHTPDLFEKVSSLVSAIKTDIG